MQQETPVSPHLWLLLLSNAVTAILAVVTTITTLRFRQRREPIELDRVRAETKSIHVTTETAEINLGRELMREMRAVIDKAEKRREEWHLKEEQMRTQVVFWRNKSEELDGKLADAQEVVWKMQSEMESYENQIRTMQATLTLEQKNYDNTQDTKPEDYTLPTKPE
jgi:peptidoglycan hydrolase CwlO-like protein